MRKKKFSWKWVVSGVLILLFLGYFLVYPTFRGIAVSGYTIKKEAAFDTYKEKGVVTSGETLQILSKVAGKVEAVLVKENDEVREGDPLLLLDSSDYQGERNVLAANLLALEAKKEEGDISLLMTSSPQEYLASVKEALSMAEANLSLASKELEGKQALFDSGSLPKIEMDGAKTNYENAFGQYKNAKNRYEQMSAYLKELEDGGLSRSEIDDRFYDSLDRQQQSAIEALQAQMALLDRRIEDCTLLAPGEGKILAVPALGQSVVAVGTPLIVFQPSLRLHLEAEVLTDVAYYLTEGDTVEIEVSFRGNKRSIPGRITEIYDFATEKTSALGLSEYRVKVLIDWEEEGADAPEEEGKDSTGTLLQEGYQTDVSFLLYSEASAVTVPLSAVFEEDGTDYVFVVEGDRARKRPVTLSYRANTFQVVDEGLEEGEVIILDASEKDLEEGVRVKLH